MTTAITLFQTEFEGRKLTTLTYKGRPCWLAGQVGALLGYENPSRFVEKLAADWSDEAVRGCDFDLVEHSDLDHLKRLVPDSVGSHARSVVVIYESGLHLALLRSRKSVGRRLRRFLATEVLPQLVRSGEYSPDRKIDTSGRVVQARDPREVDLDFRLRALEIRERELSLREREIAIEQIARDLEKRAARRAEPTRRTSRELEQARADARARVRWQTADEIARRLGVTQRRVNKIAKALGLKSVAAITRGESYYDSDTQEGSGFCYSPESAAQIEASLRRRRSAPLQ